MAKKTITITTVIDDLTGEEISDGKTVTFGYEGVTYEIDLSTKNAEKLHKALEGYIAAGRRVGTVKRASGARKSSADSERLNTIREWANANGYTVGDRGRIKAEIVEAYDAAH
jgi:hypothetical protein